MSEPTDSDPEADREGAWTRTLKRMKGWTAPGPDGITGFWLKAFPGVMCSLKRMYWEVLDQEREVPEWLVRGRTVLIPKGDEWAAHQYR